VVTSPGASRHPLQRGMELIAKCEMRIVITKYDDDHEVRLGAGAGAGAGKGILVCEEGL